MAPSDALVVVEDWISEHYFTSEATKKTFTAQVLARRKAWDAAHNEGHSTTRSRFTEARNNLARDLAEAYEDPDATPTGRARQHDLLRRIGDEIITMLGYRHAGLRISDDGPILRCGLPGIEGDPLVIVRAAPLQVETEVFAKNEPTLAEPIEIHDEQYAAVAPLLSALFVTEDGPKFALILAGRWAIVAEAARWAEGRCLAVDLQTICQRNDLRRGGEVDRALTCLEAGSLAPDADGTIWWSTVLEDSVKHTVGVSKDLREGVRLSIEIIANDVVARRKAQGREPLPTEDAQPLAMEALRYLYRILFLLFAEASLELEVLPVGAPEYDQGYSVDRLRALVLVELASPEARQGTHFHDSLEVLFRLVDRGHTPAESETDAQGLAFNSLRADLFNPEATRRISEIKLSNAALQQVLQKLLLSKESRGRDRGFISYVELGINQLGAVYEGLMSYTGSFAAEDLYEVAPGGDNEKGSWVVPVDRASDLAESDFVRKEDEVTGERVPVIHRRGTFVFRLSGRERQQSASFYTPEVLTRFTVGQALEELLDQDDTTTPADDILTMTVCEPALGSGAFAIEAVRQLAEEYLKRKERELGQRVDPEERPQVLQRIKASIALHQVYGVDLNATAVELAEISLWLDTMAAGLQAPWFGLRLRRGNSLIGARHAVYSPAQVTDKSWLKTPPTDVPLASLVAGEPISGIHHFLLPAEGWGATAEAKEARELIPDAVKAVKGWRKQVRAKPTKKQVDQLRGLSERTETLWEYAWRRLTIAEAEARRAIPIWGQDQMYAGGGVSREQIEESLADQNRAYRRLRLIMDAWCAMWFWPLTESVSPPSLADWLDALTQILGQPAESLGGRKSRRGPDQGVLSVDGWEALGEAEALDRAWAQAKPVEQVVADHPWLEVVRRVAARQGFFHWELDFATVFGRGGFDLQVGNPPWVRPRTDVDALLAEHDPWWMLALKPSEAARKGRREGTLLLPGARGSLIDGVGEMVASAEYLGSRINFPVLAGLQPDTYRCFMAQTWEHLSARGTVGLIHPETHFTDEKAARLREETYQRLRRHWQFVNELVLFEVHHLVRYGVHAYGKASKPNFLNASTLYHPETILRSFAHDGTGAAPGFKDDQGQWDQRPHSERIIRVDPEVLSTWRDVLEDSSVPPERTRMLYTVNAEVAAVLAKLVHAPRIGSLGLQFSSGWHEKMDRTKGRFEQRWGRPESWRDVILQGPHLHVNNPGYKIPNSTTKHNQDWSEGTWKRCPPTTSRSPRTSPPETRPPTTPATPTGTGAPPAISIAWPGEPWPLTPANVP